MSELDALLARTVTDGDCLLWTGHLTRKGYARLYDPEPKLAHREAYRLAVGPIESDLDHLCGNKACINPAHLEPVTAAENNRRAMFRRTHCRNGHPRIPENVYVYRGTPHCRLCRAAAWRALYDRRKTQ
jgi:hypothetical protein